MRRDPFLNLCLVVFLITLLAIQHSVAVFGPSARQWVADVDDELRAISLGSGNPLPAALRTPKCLRRAAALFNDSWRRVQLFDEWLMEYNISPWDIVRTPNRVETDLEEARFHVANAEVFTAAMREKERALRELSRAATSLQAAEPLVQANLASRLTAIKEEIAATVLDERYPTKLSAASFEAIKTDLDHLIQLVRLAKT